MTEQERNEILEGLPSNVKKSFSKLLDILDKKLEKSSKPYSKGNSKTESN